MNALAIPAASLLPALPAAKAGAIKMAGAAARPAEQAPDAQNAAGFEPFHALMQSLSEPEEEPKAKAKPEKKESNSETDLLMAPATVAPAKESRPPLALSLPNLAASLPKAAVQETAAAQTGIPDSETPLESVDAPPADAIQTGDPGLKSNPKSPLKLAALKPTPKITSPAASGVALRHSSAARADASGVPRQLERKATVHGKPGDAEPVTALLTPEIISNDAAELDLQVAGSPAVDVPAKPAPEAPAEPSLLRPLQFVPEVDPKTALTPASEAARTARKSTSKSAPGSNAEAAKNAPRTSPAPPTQTALFAIPLAAPTPLPDAAPAEAASKSDAKLSSRTAPRESQAQLQTGAPREERANRSAPFNPSAGLSEQNSTPEAPLANAAAVAPAGGAQTAQIAFEARLHPVLTASIPLEVHETPAGSFKIPSSNAAQASQESSNPAQPAAASAEKRDENSHEPPERQARPATAAAKTETAAQPQPPSGTGANLAPPAGLAPAAAPAAHATPAAPTPSPAPAVATEPVPPADPAPAPAAATDIKIALNDNGQRVELRVTERGGDIHVAVRTPDSQLASALRDDLPALSSRLEQSGFHSEMWRPAANSTVESRTIETSSGNAAGDSRQHSGEKQQQENPQQNPRNPQQTLHRKSDRKEFSWLFNSIR